MATIDYGAVLFKNGKQVNHEMFMDMFDAVGWVDAPRIKYPDCDYLDKWGYSDCSDCQKVHMKQYHSEEYGDFEEIDTDCKGNDLWDFRPKIDRNYYVYVGDEHLTVAAYKYSFVVLCDKKVVAKYWGVKKWEEQAGLERRSRHFKIDDVDFSVKAILPDQVHKLSFRYNGDYYDIVYGYCIDPDMKIWDDAKNRYLGKRGARKVDNLYRRIRKSRKFYH